MFQKLTALSFAILTILPMGSAFAQPLPGKSFSPNQIQRKGAELVSVNRQPVVLLEPGDMIRVQAPFDCLNCILQYNTVGKRSRKTISVFLNEKRVAIHTPFQPSNHFIQLSSVKQGDRIGIRLLEGSDILIGGITVFRINDGLISP